MSFRTKLFLLFLATVLASVSAVTYSVTHYTRAAYEEADMQRTQALVEQFQKEFTQQRELVARQVENVTNSEVTLKMAIDLERANADQSLYVRDAAGAAQEHGLNFMEFVISDGTLISSAQYPARVGYINNFEPDCNINRNESLRHSCFGYLFAHLRARLGPGVRPVDGPQAGRIPEIECAWQALTAMIEVYSG